MSNFDSSWLPVTTSGVVDTVLSRPAFHCTLTQLSGSVHTDRAQPKVGPACLSKLTISPCATGFQIVSWDDKTCVNASILYVCCKLLQSDFISGAKRVRCVKRNVAGVWSSLCQVEGHWWGMAGSELPSKINRSTVLQLAFQRGRLYAL